MKASESSAICAFRSCIELTTYSFERPACATSFSTSDRGMTPITSPPASRAVSANLHQTAVGPAVHDCNPARDKVSRQVLRCGRIARARTHTRPAKYTNPLQHVKPRIAERVPPPFRPVAPNALGVLRCGKDPYCEAPVSRAEPVYAEAGHLGFRWHLGLLISRHSPCHGRDARAPWFP